MMSILVIAVTLGSVAILTNSVVRFTHEPTRALNRLVGVFSAIVAGMSLTAYYANTIGRALLDVARIIWIPESGAITAAAQAWNTLASYQDWFYRHQPFVSGSPNPGPETLLPITLFALALGIRSAIFHYVRTYRPKDYNSPAQTASYVRVHETTAVFASFATTMTVWLAVVIPTYPSGWTAAYSAVIASLLLILLSLPAVRDTVAMLFVIPQKLLAAVPLFRGVAVAAAMIAAWGRKTLSIANLFVRNHIEPTVAQLIGKLDMFAGELSGHADTAMLRANRWNRQAEANLRYKRTPETDEPQPDEPETDEPQPDEPETDEPQPDEPDTNN